MKFKILYSALRQYLYQACKLSISPEFFIILHDKQCWEWREGEEKVVSLHIVGVLSWNVGRFQIRLCRCRADFRLYHDHLRRINKKMVDSPS